MKKYFKLSLALSSLVLLSGCGSLSGEDENVETGTAYYHNIEGIKYDCGDAPEGTTDSSGKFVYEKGENCTFYIGDKELRSVSNRVLEDGAILVETNDANIQLLQTLDNDANPHNGIKILPKVSEYFDIQETISDYLIPDILSDLITVNKATMATLSTALEVISGYDGASVDLDEARDNLEYTLELLTQDGTEYTELQ
jgi:uncharacterized membrane protein YkoI